MKKTYYLFNPGILERKDNTLKFTPFEEDENGGYHTARDVQLPEFGGADSGRTSVAQTARTG